jgi:uncharacterized coiled-coil protein SlyX
MSQYTPAGSQAHGEAITELLDELSFQKALLNSLDDSVENQEEAEDEVRKEIKAIEKKIRDLRRGTTSTASDFAGPSASQDSQTLSSQPSSNNRRNNTAMFETPGKSSSAYQGESANYFAFNVGQAQSYTLSPKSLLFVSIIFRSSVNTTTNAVDSWGAVAIS